MIQPAQLGMVLAPAELADPRLEVSPTVFAAARPLIFAAQDRRALPTEMAWQLLPRYSRVALPPRSFPQCAPTSSRSECPRSAHFAEGGDRLRRHSSREDCNREAPGPAGRPQFLLFRPP